MQSSGPNRVPGIRLGSGGDRLDVAPATREASVATRPMGWLASARDRLRSRVIGWHRHRYLTNRELDDLESRLVWIFASPRSGSTWLLNMLAEAPAPGVATINESWAGELFNRTFAWRGEGGGVTISSSANAHVTVPGWVLAPGREHLWRPLMRAFLLEGFRDQLTNGQAQTNWKRPYLVVKEPNTSEAADALVKVLPRSRILFLVRDGRDVVDSLLIYRETKRLKLDQRPSGATHFGIKPAAVAEWHDRWDLLGILPDV